MHFANLNGTFLPNDALVISASNSSLRYGWGLFETMLIDDNFISLAKYHWERLWDGMQKMQFDIPIHFTQQFLEEEILKTVKKNQLERLCRIRLQVFTEMDGVFDGNKKTQQFLIECFSLEKTVTEWNENGWICGIADGIVKQQDDYSNLKTCNMQPYVVAAQMAKANKWNDSFVVNQQGNIIESSIANIFWVKGEKIYTPPLSEGCIAGVMRKFILEESGDLFIEEKPLTRSELYNADEIFLTNAIRRIKWVSHFNSVIYKNNITGLLFKKLF